MTSQTTRIIRYSTQDSNHNTNLNHLKHKVPCWEAEIENDVLLYDVNWEYQTTLSDPFGINCGFYLPASQIHRIHNIKKRKSNKAS